METKKTLRETDDFLHCEAFAWCKGVEETEEEEQEMDDKTFLVLWTVGFVIMVIIMIVLSKTMGIVWD